MQKKNIIYEIIMMLLALLVVAIVIIQMSFELSYQLDTLLTAIDNVIWIIFVLDYSIRFYESASKKDFIIHNKIDLITIIPLNSLFRALRVLKVAKVLKMLKFTRGLMFLGRFTTKLNDFIKTNNFNIVLTATIIIIFIGAAAIAIVENMMFSDALWWSFVTATTVG